MADLFKLADFEATAAPNNPQGGHDDSSGLLTGALRRKYNFGDRVSELNVAQDPFFRFLSKVSKKPTNDPQFKYTERRPSWHKRYAYAAGIGANTSFSDSNTNNADADDDIWYAKMGTDYSNAGNLQNILGNTVTQELGVASTKPQFFLVGQVVKFPVTLGSASGALDYISARVLDVADGDTGYVNLKLQTVKGVGTTGSVLKGVPASIDNGSVAAKDAAVNEETLAPFKCYVVGSAFEEGSGYPDTWKDQPWSTQYGQTQIWKTAMAMTNTARATELKYSANEWARVWKEHLIAHKWDIEQSLLFGKQFSDDTGINYTQGAVDYCLNFGNIFSLDIATKTADDFLDDLSGYMDPRYASQSPTVYFCPTSVYNWLHKLGGYFKNNLEVSSQFRADMALTGKKKVFGVDISTFSTPYGDINVARNIHLDSTDIKLLGVGMKNCSWRPLNGNGVNRDTSVYVGVQTLENSGIDRRVDLILTEGGMEWSMPESHAVWK